jgi:hypothetical protein
MWAWLVIEKLLKLVNWWSNQCLLGQLGDSMTNFPSSLMFKKYLSESSPSSNIMEQVNQFFTSY